VDTHFPPAKGFLLISSQLIHRVTKFRTLRTLHGARGLAAVRPAAVP
jgi:hypothetical protein